MDRTLWLSPRALRLHAVILVVLPGFAALCAWQVDRALNGNELSWAYVFEWPIFGCYAIYMWWRLVHEAPEPEAATSGNGAGPVAAEGALNGMGTPSSVTPEPVAEESDDEALDAYNRYLAELAALDEATDRTSRH